MAYESITSQVKKANCIIDFDTFDPKLVRSKFAPLKEYCDTNCNEYGFIFHDRDIIEKTGKVKTYHIHAVLTLKKKKRISTIINSLADVCSVNPMAVTVKKMTSFEGSFQYLTHKNDPDKYQYGLDEVITNLDEDEVDIIMNARSAGIGYPELYGICLGADSLLEVIEKVGIGVYQHYRSTIIDIWNLINQARKDRQFR